MDAITKALCEEFNIKEEHGENVVKLLDEGNTIPFIARYRKELTGAMDDQVLRKFADKLEALRALAERKADVIRLIDEQGKLTEEIKAQVENAKTVTEVDDIYRPFRPKRKTRATIAKDKGLEPLADAIYLQLASFKPYEEAEKYIDSEKGVETIEDAISGAMDIIAENVSDDAENRKAVRAKTYVTALITSTNKEENPVYEMYYEFAEKVNKVANHRILALDRGEKEGVLAVKIDADENVMHELLFSRAVNADGGECAEIVKEAIRDSYKRLIAPSIDTEIRNMLTERAQEAAIDTQIEFLYTTPITGNNELFDIATDIANKFDADIKLVDEAYAKLLEISKEQMKIWEKLYDKAFYHNKFDTCREYERACEYHNGPGKCVERPKEESSNIKSEPINMETGRYIFGQDPNYRQSNSADNIKSMGPRMD